MAIGKITAKFVGQWPEVDEQDVAQTLTPILNFVKPDEPAALLLVRGNSTVNFGLPMRRALAANRGGWVVVIVSPGELGDYQQWHWFETEYGITIIEIIERDSPPEMLRISFSNFAEMIQNLCGVSVPADPDPDGNH